MDNHVQSLYINQKNTYENCLYAHPFRIFYTLNGDDKTPGKIVYTNQSKIPKYITDLADSFLEAYQLFVNDYQLMDPIKKGIYFDKGAKYIDVMIADIPLQKGLVAAELVDNSDFFAGLDGWEMDGKSVRILLDRNLIPNTATPIHELFHVFQYNYCNFNNMWFMEGLARWAQNLTHQRKMIEERLPQTLDALDFLLNRAHDAEYFWRRLFSFFDDDKIVIKSLLEHSAKQALQIDKKIWTNKDKKNPSNNTYILQAILDTMEICQYSKNVELNTFIQLLTHYIKGVNFRFDTPQIQRLLTVLEKCNTRYVQRKDNILYSKYLDIKEKTLRIEKLECKNLTEYELDSFNLIRHIDGDLIVSSNDIESLNAFNYLKSIKNLYIKDMHKLKMINGFNALEEISALEISNNPNLEEINGFNILFKYNHIIERSIKVMKNKKLEDVSFLKGIKEVGSSFYLHHNNLKSLEGLEELECVNASFSLSSNQLTDLIPLKKLKKVHGMLGIAYNDLRTLNGLEKLIYINTIKWNDKYRSLVIQGNRYLKDISALSNCVSTTKYCIIYLDSDNNYVNKPIENSPFYKQTLVIDSDKGIINTKTIFPLFKEVSKTKILFANTWVQTLSNIEWLDAHFMDFKNVKKVTNYAHSHGITYIYGQVYNAQKFLFVHQAYLKQEGLKFLVNDMHVMSILLNKDKFFDFMYRDKTLRKMIPKYYKSIEDVQYPCVIKDKNGSNGESVKIIYNRDELKNISKNDVLNEYIAGKEEYATNIFYSEGEIVLDITYQKNFTDTYYVLNQKTKYKMINQKVSDKFIDEFKCILDTLLKRKGKLLCCIDYKIQNNMPKIFEINVRLGHTLARYQNDFKEMMKAYIKACDSQKITSQ